MARSRIISDITQMKMPLSYILQRFRVILSYCSNEEIENWVNNETQGYNEENVPSYRITTGEIYLDLKELLKKHKDIELKKEILRYDCFDKIYEVRIVDGVHALESSVNTGKKQPLSSWTRFMLQEYELKRFKITGGYVKISDGSEKEILEKIRNQALDFLLSVEKKYGNLDEYDIDCPNNSNQTANFNIFADNSIKIGDNNSIKIQV